MSVKIIIYTETMVSTDRELKLSSDYFIENYTCNEASIQSDPYGILLVIT